MKKVVLKDTSLEVSAISLGTVHYGTAIDLKTAEAQLDHFVENGGNFIDTAHMYGDWVPGEKGRSEKLIGSWMKKRGLRHRVILSTKGGHPDLDDINTSRATVKDIVKDLDESLRFLGTDYIDLYFYHRDNPAVPPEELLGVLEEARSRGKIRYYGCSNWKVDRIRRAKQFSFPGFVCNQIMYSLADINEYRMKDKTLVLMDKETYNYHAETGMSVMAYTALAKGYFTKKALGLPQSLESANWYTNPSNERIFEELVRAAQAYNASLAEIELAFLMHQDFTTIPIVSFSNHEQLEQGIKSCALSLDRDTVETFNRLKRYVYRAC